MGTHAPSTAEARIARARGTAAEAIAGLLGCFDSANAAELLAAADALEALARQVVYGQVLAAAAIDRDCPAAARAPFRNTADFLQARLRIPRSEAKRRLGVAGKPLPAHSLTGEPVPAGYPRLGVVASSGAACLQGLSKAVDALDTAQSILRGRSWPQQLHPQDSELLGRMETSLAEALVARDPDFLSPLVKRWLTLLDQDGTAPEESELKHRQGLFRRGEYRGLNHFELWADPAQTETLLAVLNAGNNPRSSGSSSGNRGQADAPADRRSAPQRQLDTLVSALAAALSTDSLPATGGHRPQVQVTIDYRHLLGEIHSRRPGRSGSGGAAAMVSSAEFTGPINPGTIRRIACDAELIPVVLGGAGEVLDLGRRRRLFSRSQRAALFARDRGCTFPDCTIPASWCEAHHIQSWRDGGATSVQNGALLCSHHHHLIHQGDWQLDNRLGLPRFRPPPWIDPQQRALRNNYHRLDAVA
ncbi:MAG: HNH endonuclease [Renibacterium salmoninarum]|nr:HNH endonuclease [Renibacterium salmoninarum]